MASSGSGMSFWLKFFIDAGIPAGESANHAVTFTDHRIQTDMLLDLNKEYLNEMGISMMGDVIAILKHAKTVHAQTVREKALKGAPKASSSPPTRRSTPASRIVGHYLGAASDPDARPMNQTTTLKMSDELAARLGPSPATKVVKVPVKVQLGSQQKEEVPVPKARRVFPEHEGKYKITMPTGSTARSMKILQKKGVAPQSKPNTVFDRLGTGIDGSGDAATSSSASSFSVFSRLGGQSIKRAATSTSVDPDDDDDDVSTGSPLAYAGVLKDTPTKKPKIQKINFDFEKVPAITISKNITRKNTAINFDLKTIPARTINISKSTTVASAAASTASDDHIQTEGVLARGAVEKKSARARLGGPVIVAATSSTTSVPVKPTKVVTKKTGLAARLGPQKMEVSSSQDSKVKGIFSRLGKPI